MAMLVVFSLAITSVCEQAPFHSRYVRFTNLKMPRAFLNRLQLGRRVGRAKACGDRAIVT